jgi:hypothetical protein
MRGRLLVRGSTSSRPDLTPPTPRFAGRWLASTVLAASLFLGACSSGSDVYGVVVDDATLGTPADSQGICGDATTPAITVKVTTAKNRGATSALAEPSGPVWNELVMVAPRGEVAGGIRVDVTASCASGDVHLGAAHFAPPMGAFEGRVIALRDVGSVSELHLHLERMVAVETGGEVVYDGGYYAEDPDYGYDDGYGYDDPGYADGSDASDSATCYDDGTCTGDDGSDWAPDDSSDPPPDDSSDPPDDPPPDDGT